MWTRGSRLFHHLRASTYVSYRVARSEDVDDDDLRSSKEETRRVLDVPAGNTKPSYYGISNLRKFLDCKSFYTTLIINTIAFILPALIPVFDKLFLGARQFEKGGTNSSLEYVGSVILVFTEGLPRAAYVVVADSPRRTPAQRIRLTHSLLLLQLFTSALVSACLALGAGRLVKPGVLTEPVEQSIAHVRSSVALVIPMAMEAALSASCRALGRSEIPLYMGTLNFLIHVFYALAGKLRILERPVHLHIILVAQSLSLIFGFICYTWSIVRHLLRTSSSPISPSELRPTRQSLTAILIPCLSTSSEAILKSALRLGTLAALGPLGTIQRSALAIYTDLRHNLLESPIRALEATNLTFTAHLWSRLQTEAHEAAEPTEPTEKLPITDARILLLLSPTLQLSLLALLLELGLSISFALPSAGACAYAAWHIGLYDVITGVETLFRRGAVTYVLGAVGSQLAAVLLIAKPSWWFTAAAIPQLVWGLSWIAGLAGRKKGWEHGVGLGEGALVVWSAAVDGGQGMMMAGVCVALGLWVWGLRRAGLRVERWRKG